MLFSEILRLIADLPATTIVSAGMTGPVTTSPSENGGRGAS